MDSAVTDDRRGASAAFPTTRAAGAHTLWLAVFSSVMSAVSLGSGCVTIYQPERAIHRPVVIEHAPSNFAGLRVLLRCLAHDEYLKAAEASKICSKLAEEFEKQGAITEWVAPSGGSFVEPEMFEGQRPDLTVEIQAKIDHEYDYPLTLVICVLTFSMVPWVSEQTHSQRVVVLGRDGSVLTEELFRERFVEYRGLGVWSTNWVLDWAFRTDEEDVSGDAGKKEFTEDFYGHIRQLAFNARVRSELLGLTASPRRRGPLPPLPGLEGAAGEGGPSGGSSDDAAASGEGGEPGDAAGGGPGGEPAGVTGGASSEPEPSPEPSAEPADPAGDDDDGTER